MVYQAIEISSEINELERFDAKLWLTALIEASYLNN